jgi:ABC-type transporter Mla maintaining outer membrane lipid asymmetry ATPase subunit MlaF
MPETLQAEQVTWFADHGAARVLDRVSFTVAPDDVLVVAGQSGCGRSALMSLCAGLLKPDGGAIRWDGRALVSMTPRELSEARQQVGCMFQAPALISNLTVHDNIALPLRAWGIAEQEVTIRVQDSLEQHGLRQARRAFPEDLPLAALRFAALARALVVEPRILLLDEPTAGMDPRAEESFMSVIGEYRLRRRVALLVNSNREQQWRRIGGRVLTLARGQLHEQVPEGYH